MSLKQSCVCGRVCVVCVFPGPFPNRRIPAVLLSTGLPLQPQGFMGL